MGTAFSSIPDDDASVHSPSSPPWSSAKSSGVQGKKPRHVVNWHVPHDPENPLDWTTKSRWLQVVLVSILTLEAAMAPSMPFPAVADTLEEFKAPDGILMSLVVSIFNLGSVFGTALASPLSELHGRYPLYSISNILFLACNAACALSPNLGVLLMFRFMSGFTGAIPFAIGCGTISDTTQRPWRSRAVSAYSFALMLGTAIGPAIGGFVAQYFGWRWIFWSLCILAAINSIALVLFLGETSSRTLLEKQEKKVRKTTRDPGFFSALSSSGVSPGEALSEALKKPFRLLITPPPYLRDTPTSETLSSPSSPPLSPLISPSLLPTHIQLSASLGNSDALDSSGLSILPACGLCAQIISSIVAKVLLGNRQTFFLLRDYILSN
ncbi:MFS multidrug transporter [Colletotrichum graminicola]|nr:MFS multidrug transporter [Colletotrichum graminicola]